MMYAHSNMLTPFISCVVKLFLHGNVAHRPIARYQGLFQNHHVNSANHLEHEPLTQCNMTNSLPTRCYKRNEVKQDKVNNTVMFRY